MKTKKRDLTMLGEGDALFIPLRREYFEAFESGEKTEEYRPYGPRWNERTCRIGRRVVISLGYGTQRRLTGTITGFRQSEEVTASYTWKACYGAAGHKVAACIGITLDPPEHLVSAAMAVADEFDERRDCGWNFSKITLRESRCAARLEFPATQVEAFRSLGRECEGAILELALLHTLRPCRDCGSETLYVSSYQVCCCTCFGYHEGCENRREAECEGDDPEEQCCCNCAENANLPDAITRWNIHHGDAGERGRVEVVIC